MVFSVVTAYIGGNAMVWHMRSGFAIFTLLAFRLRLGLRRRPLVALSRLRLCAEHQPALPARREPCRTSITTSATTRSAPARCSPCSASSPLQVATGLIADDEIATTGPLIKYVSSATSSLATSWHKNYGQWIIIGLVVLHLGAIAFYWFRRRQNLVGPMWHGDKLLTADVPRAGRQRPVADDRPRDRPASARSGVTAVVRLGG